MKYKGYQGTVTYDDKAKIFHGEVICLKDIITFQGTTVDELEQAFKDSIDDYLEFCEKKRQTSEKPFFHEDFHLSKLAEEAEKKAKGKPSVSADKLWQDLGLK